LIIKKKKERKKAMSSEFKNLIDYFVVCGLDIKSGLEPEPSEAYAGNTSFPFFNLFVIKYKK
jgi:hypothetical protein